jgi:ATP-dependent helicase/DNAse subunit B
LETAFGMTPVDMSEFAELLTSAAARTRVQKTGLEDAGIQFLSRLEARGLVFSKIFVPGLVSGALPQPVRSLPLLSSTERKKVLGGTLESQLTFARYLYGNLCAAAPDIVLSRPTMGRNGEISLPSPFWPQGGERMIGPLISWKDNLPAMQRARWVQQSISGTAAFRPGEDENACSAPPGFQVKPLVFSEPIPVSELQSALQCPAQYFFRHILGLSELDEFEPGIAPLERGRQIHAILASFVLRAIGIVQKGEAYWEELLALLKETVTDAFGPRLSETAWQVEFERLIGRPDYPGLLIKWLEEEWTRIAQGWSWLAVESKFERMELEGTPACVKGRLDRIDSHPQEGLVCWDYKTGTPPGRKEVVEEITQPQLPAYLLAIMKGNVRGLPAIHEAGGAGYIEMSSPGKTGHTLLFDPAADNRPLLEDWENRVSAAINAILAGDISPAWLKDNKPCKRCPYQGLCGAP